MRTLQIPDIRPGQRVAFAKPNFQTLYLFTLVLLFAVAFSPNLIAATINSVNTPSAVTLNWWGTFEAPNLPPTTFQKGPVGAGWTFHGGTGIASNNSAYTNMNPNAPQGDQVLYVKMYGWVDRPINIAPGTYRLRMLTAQRGVWQPGGAPPLPQNQTFRVVFDGQEIGRFTPNSTSYQVAWTTSFKVTSSSQRLQILGLNPQGGDNTAFIDKLEVDRLLPWSSGASWVGGVKPGPNDNAIVRPNATMVLDQNATVATLSVQGRMEVAHNTSVNLNAKRVIVEGTGARFLCGRANAPYLKRFLLTLTGNNPNDAIPGMGAKVFGARMGGAIEIHGAPLLSWTQLDQHAGIGASSIHLKEPVNWRVRDKIVVVSSRINMTEAEERIITGISADKRTVTLNAALQHNHKGVVKTYSEGGRTWTADLRGQVGLLTHNITIQGENPGASGFGGHIMVHTNGKANISGVELYNMGQKSALGRYPFHWHMLGSLGAGQYFKNSSVHKSFNRALTIHGTWSTLTENNFFYDHIGHGVFLEDGSERLNVIRKNVTLLTRRPAPGEEVTPSDNQFVEVTNQTPSSYWITNPENTFEDNVAAGSQGTGFWFAFPERPMGESRNDPRFSSMQPHTSNLISFKGNMGHSNHNAFDIFDRLDANHAIVPNLGWANPAQHVMENCTWYGNWLGVYTGTGGYDPTENLIFRNNIFFANATGTQFASNNIVDQSLFVADVTVGITFLEQSAYRLYDGPGQVRNSHFVGFNTPKGILLSNSGASTKFVNHLFSGNTTDHTGFLNVRLADFDITPGDPLVDDRNDPSVWSHVVRDLDGSLTKKNNTTIVGNHPMQLVGDEFQPSNWVNAYRSDHKFVLNRMIYVPFTVQDIPNAVITREKAGLPPARCYYGSTIVPSHQIPVIVNEGFEYTYTYKKLPPSRLVPMQMLNATAGDSYIVRFTDFGKLSGIRVASPEMSVNFHSSLASLRNATTSGFYRDPNGDYYLKLVATGPSQVFNVRWNSGVTLSVPDSDGDQKDDWTEFQEGRHPFDAGDLAAEFNNPGNYEGYNQIANVSGASVSGGSLSGTSTSSNNGDAQFGNAAYDFAADEVEKIEVRMRASKVTFAQIFFATAASPGYGSNKQQAQPYNSSSNAWTVVTFNLSNISTWNGRITDLRFDPVAHPNTSFDIDWIRAIGPGGSKVVFDNAEGGLQGPHREATVYPNPMQHALEIDLGVAGTFHTVRMTDLQGRVVREAKVKEDVSHLKWEFAGSRLPSGVYVVQMIGDDRRTQVKVIKL